MQLIRRASWKYKLMVGATVILSLLLQSCLTSGSKKSDYSSGSHNPLVAQSTPRAHILATRFFVNEAENVIQKASFSVPEAGKAIVVLQSEATKPPPKTYPTISLNGISITPKHPGNKHSVEVPVTLRAGENELVVDFNILNPMAYIAISVDSTADKLTLLALPQPIALDSKQLKVKAAVTALGVPVPNAEVTFKIAGFTTNMSASTGTGDTGVASASFSDLSTGTGTLSAKLSKSNLSAHTKIVVTATADLKFEPNNQKIRVPVGETSAVQFTISHQNQISNKRKISLSHTPNSIGVDFVLPASVLIADPKKNTVMGLLRGIIPGRYNMQVTATDSSTNTKALADIYVTVYEPFVLNSPSTIPSGLPLNAAPTKVVFRTLVTDMPKPDQLLLDEVDKRGNIIANRRGIIELRDNGKGADNVAGDGFYAGVHTVDIRGDMENGIVPTGESEKFFRLHTIIAGKTITSDSTNFPLTTLPLTSRPSDPKQLVLDRHSEDRFYANEVIINAAPSISPSRIREVVSAANEDFSIVGYHPSLNMYLVELEHNNGSTTVHNAIAALEAFPEITVASPNFEMSPASTSTYTPNDPRFPANCEATGNDNAENCQYYLQTINADEAWSWLKGRNPETNFGLERVNIGVIDNGIDFNNPDLIGTDDPEIPSNNGNPVTQRTHGTMVAGLIAAKHNNNAGIAGMALNARLIPYLSSSSWDAIGNFVTAISSEIKIVNLSITNTAIQPGMKEAICKTICSNRLVVAAAGNMNGCGLSDDIYPASFNRENVICSCNNNLPTQQGLIAVGALDHDSMIASNFNGSNSECSNARPWIDLYAPGQQIATTEKGLGITSASGTSFATPLVSGAAALLWSTYPNWSSSDVEECLLSRSRELALTPQIHPLLAGKTESEVEAMIGSIHILDVYASLNSTGITLDNNTVTENTANIAIGGLTMLDACRPTVGSINYSVSDNRFSVVNNQLILNRALNYEAERNLQLTITAPQNNGSDYVETITINVLDVNEPPSLSPIQDLFILQDARSEPIPITVTDVDTDANNLVFTAISSNTALIPNANIQFRNAGPYPTFTVTPAAGQQGHSTITLTVSDGQYSAARSFSVTVSNINPIIRFDGRETSTNPDGSVSIRIRIPVVNWQVLPAEMFVNTPIYGPCGYNNTPSRTWVNIYNAENNRYVYGFCAFSKPEHLKLIWFGGSGSSPPSQVYIELHDHANDTRYRSNILTIPTP